MFTLVMHFPSEQTVILWLDKFYCLPTSLCPLCILEAWQLLFAELLPAFPPPCHHIHLLIDKIISVEITVSDEIWKLHHTCRWRKKKGGGGRRRKKRSYNSKKDQGIILLWPLNGILPSCLSSIYAFTFGKWWQSITTPPNNRPPLQ